MTIQKSTEADKTILTIEGQVNTTTAPKLDAALSEELAAGNHLVLDFAQVAYVSSAGLRALLNAQKLANKTGRNMLIKNVNDEVADVFDMTGFIDILNVE
ncbi:MAG: STAS domain-containing protein [Oscillospiraceae bacterium]